MILLVNDANILIDLLKIDLLDEFFKLPYEFHVTDLVTVEVHEVNRGKLDTCINQGLLKKKSFAYQELMEIQLLSMSNKGLSIPDCSCLYHARETGGRLLTGDATLRKSAEKNQVRAHGILWVFDQLLENNIIINDIAHEKLSWLLSINPRLPQAECKKRLKTWSN